MKKIGVLFLMFALCVVSVTAEASLYYRGMGLITSTGQGYGNSYKLIYDDVLDITWLDYTTEVAYGWDSQMAWASDLEVTFGGQTFVDWRLPIMDESQENLYGWLGWSGPDENGYHNYQWGYNMVNSEMGHLFYVTLGNKGYYATDGTHPQDGYELLQTGEFDHLGRHYYWSGTLYSLDTSQAWFFTFDYGDQNHDYKGGTGRALAVLPGDVSAVPIPGALWLLGSGLVGLVGFRRKFKR